MNEVVRKAVERAWAFVESPRPPVPAGRSSPNPPGRLFAVGDPQAPFELFATILDNHGLIGEDGMLEAGAGLISVGDHFDYPGDPREVERNGLMILRWLAAHPPEQVVLLAGNHDLSRVQELAFETDAGFASARRYPEKIAALGDFLSFSERQREAVQSLLLARRFRLAHPAVIRASGERCAVLIAHAAVTARELGLLGLDAQRRPAVLADRLNEFLDRAVDSVRGEWERGRPAALDLRPLCVAGAAGREGGGFPAHRPANPGRTQPYTNHEWDPAAPRCFHPRELPRGLLQIVGHTRHATCLRDLTGWIAPSALAMARDGVRTLRVRGDSVLYEAGLGPFDPATDAALLMIDSEMRSSRGEAALLEMDGPAGAGHRPPVTRSDRSGAR